MAAKILFLPTGIPDMSRIKAIAQFGQQIWLDNLNRQLLDSGELARWITEDAIAGVTSNPAIFTTPCATTPAIKPKSPT